ncbi:MAG: DUF1844 domain-containing protein [Candidatus Omnitrophica bacterium]|nr:DUF1844 domain-containing protein [Candidatus Omnitrophota bacterium]
MHAHLRPQESSGHQISDKRRCDRGLRRGRGIRGSDGTVTEHNEQFQRKWRSQLAREESAANTEGGKYRHTSFKIFLSSLSMQAMIALGRIENPVSGRKSQHREQARHMIETLDILARKTAGNLNEEERHLLDESRYSLKTMYLEEFAGDR